MISRVPLFFFMLLLAGTANMQCTFAQPANNNCITAQPVIIPAGGTICINSSSLTATSSNTTNVCTAVAVNEVWFSYIAAGPVNTIIVTPNGASPLQQPVITLSDAACGSATFNTCNAAANAGGTATANWAYAGGSQVYISVAGIQGDGTFQICITSESPPPTPGSSCGGATPSCDPSNFTLGTTAGNFSSGVSPACFNIFGVPQVVQNDVWYIFTVGQAGTLEFTANLNGVAEFDWAVYNITNGCPGALVSCNYFFSGGNTGSLGLGLPAGGEFNPPINVAAGNTYAIMIDNYDNNGVGFDFSWGGTFQMAPTANFTIGTPSACNSLTTTFNNTTVGGASYSWDFGNGNTSVLQNPPAETYNTPGTYFVTLSATSAAGCTNSYSSSVEVFPDPTLNFNVTDESCAGSCDGQLTVSASGTGPFSYSWVGGGATNTNSGLCANNYDVTVTDQSNGCSVTGTGTVASGGATSDATINQPVPASPYCEFDGAIQLTSVDPGTWSGNGVNAGGLFDPSAAGPGIHTITNTIAGACGDVATINLEVLSEFDATINPPATTTFCSGDAPIQLTASSIGGSWSGNGVSPTGLFDPGTAGNGNHTITHTSAGGCPNTDQIQLTVNAGGTPTISSPSNGPFCLSDVPVQLSSDISDPAEVWSGPGVNAAGVFDPAVAGVGNHVITFTLPPPCGGSDTWNVSVEEVTFTYSSTEPLCNGDATGQISFTNVAGGSMPYNYSVDGGINFSALPDFASLTASNYNLVVEDANGCASLMTNEVLGEPAAITLQIDLINSQCGQPNGSALVTASGGVIVLDYFYQWDDPAMQTSPLASNLAPNDALNPTYDVVVTDQNGCTATTSAVIGSIGGFPSQMADSTDISCFGLCDGSAEVSLGPGVVGNPTFDWTDGSGVTVGTNIMVSDLCPGTYTVVITDQDGCVSSNVVTIDEPPLLTTSISGNATLCLGGQDQLTASTTGGTGLYSYTWTADPVNPQFSNSSQSLQIIHGNVATDYTVQVSDQNGCIATAIQPITILPPLSINVSPIDTICPHQSSVITFSGSGGNGAYSFGWSVNSDHITSPISSPTTAVDLTLQLYLEDGCTQPGATETIVVPVFPNPNISMFPPDTVGCIPMMVNFGDTSSPAPIGYAWDFGDPNSTSNNSSQQFDTHTYEESGVYQALLNFTSQDGCTYAESVNITAHPKPTADFLRAPLEPSDVEFLDPEVIYEDLSIDATSFWIHFGDGDSSNISPVEHIYQDSGLYFPFIIAQNEFGCIDTAFGELHVQPHYTFFVPNAFTPNHDGINEVFRVEAYGLAEMRLELFDRWGNLIRVFDHIDDVWDGTYRGKLLPNGVYTWNAVTRDTKGLHHKYNGIVFLIGGN